VDWNQILISAVLGFILGLWASSFGAGGRRMLAPIVFRQKLYVGAIASDKLDLSNEAYWYIPVEVKANNFLDSLVQGAIPEMEPSLSILERKMAVVPGNVESEEEERDIKECNEWAVNQGLPEGEYVYELCDPDSGEPLAIIDLAWPDGLQPGYSQSIALLLNEPTEVEEIVNRAGYKYFKDVESFKNYVKREILAEVPVQA